MATSAIDIIKKHLDDRAKKDPQFAVNYSKKDKNIKDCYAYIIGQARKKATANVCCMSDDEVFGLAVHYYDEDDIDMSAARKERKAANVKAVKADTSASDNKDTAIDKPTSSKKHKPKKSKPKVDAKPKKRFVQLELFDFNDI